MYAIVDIETTGGYAERNKIVEIAIIIFDGREVIEEFETLINPERNIPSNISAIHGISNEMVQEAPKFYEVAKKVYQLLDGKIFVAHNVNFDYGFIKNEFEQLGSSLNLKKLCTVRLARKIVQGLSSYSLGNLCQHLNIMIKNRHRAGGDAKATVELFKYLCGKDTDGFIQKSLKKNSREAVLPANLPKEEFDLLPEDIGVYYFLDEKQNIIYIGKAKNIKSRIAGHFSGTATSWSKQNFKSKIFGIRYELTGNELIALLLESYEIRKHWPMYNRAQKYTAPNYGIFQYIDKNNYTRLIINKVSPGDKAIISFKNMSEARHYLQKKVREFNLCPKLCGLQKSPSTCFDYRLNLCQGACAGTIPAEDYNQSVSIALENFVEEHGSYAIIGRGKEPETNSIVVVDKGLFYGFGYIYSDVSISNLEDAKRHINYYKDNQDIQRIISVYLKKSKDIILKFNSQRAF